MKKTMKLTIEGGKLILVETTELDSGGDLDLSGTAIKELPDNLSVGGEVIR